MKPSNFINLEDWPEGELLKILTLCKKVKNETLKGQRHTYLKGKNIGMVFDKASLRTRVSFEVGINQLGGQAIVLDTCGKLGEREPIADFARVISRYTDALVVRTFEEAGILELAEYTDIPIINALTDESHPCQAMGDIFTLGEHLENLNEKILTYVGDSNNVARSLIRACSLVGVRVHVASPEGYHFSKTEKEEFGNKGHRFFYDPKEAVEDADALYTDVWTSMGQEEEKNKRLTDFTGFELNTDLVSRAKKGALIMHCLPAHRGEEISHDVIESDSSVVFDQAENRLHIQKAIMVTLIGEK